MRPFLPVAVIALLSAESLATAPQAPFAEGSPESIRRVIRAANTCGVRNIRVEPSGDRGFVGAFYTVFGTGNSCLDHWLTTHGRKLKLEPRWYCDDFTSDAPTGKQCEP